MFRTDPKGATMARETNAGKTGASKGVPVTGKAPPREGPPAHTKAWYENVQAGARGNPPPNP